MTNALYFQIIGEVNLRCIFENGRKLGATVGPIYYRTKLEKSGKSHEMTSAVGC